MKIFKRIIAIIAVLAIVVMFAITVFVGINMNKYSLGTFLTCLSASFMLPAAIYLGMWLYRIFNRKEKLEEFEKKESQAFEEAKKYKN